ncbi:YoaK family protein [Alicyclobacillus acidoterrestris]|uniref:DUF1275 domain-containing protein n=1 Tax=Alicyclobacillus acidoterrestris (strain ATCC 49025 / DSM 3922 / CIP 106132 / NCIMB 13137 / GD3B) TaxID=1356854 RepID=T0D0S8_ALIAG|nr:YoaK family protein [Alicyclobacillus acidoterrestris]EPZ45127.1 hypothetical protein N007_09970 [Alicyclobacillus acidoterrestris ATCC 49025]UNO48411.1 DUF1275 domain-containing protein [Alicyclobacillus acidoterrestris]
MTKSNDSSAPAVVDKLAGKQAYSVLLLLSGVGGYIDAFSCLALSHVFTANMTGNVVLLGIEVVSGDILSSVRSGIALVAFFIGVIVGWLTLHAGSASLAPRRRMLAALALEAVSLVVLAVMLVVVPQLSEGQVELCIALSSVGMGIQSVVARLINIQGVTTTYITGMMVTAVESILKGFKTPSTTTTASTSNSSKSSQWKFPMAAAVVYVAGALAGGLLTLHLYRLTGFGALLVVLCVMVITLWGRRSKRRHVLASQNVQTLSP